MPITREDMEAVGFHDELPEEFAARWIGYLRTYVNGFEALGERIDIDVNRAVRGEIVGAIGGDAVNPLDGSVKIAYGAALHGPDPADGIIVRSGWLSTWTASTGAIGEFGHRLPTLVANRYEEIFQRWTPETTLLSDNPVVDFARFETNGRALIADLQDVENTEGLPRDIEYARRFKRQVRELTQS